jgi:ABC-type thiamine transport system substrate-binding protein
MMFSATKPQSNTGQIFNGNSRYEPSGIQHRWLQSNAMVLGDSVTSGSRMSMKIEFVGVLKGARQPDLARKFVDFMLSVQFQADMPLQMFVFPVNPQAKLPEVFEKYAQVPQNPASVSAEDIARNRETWIQQWTETVPVPL